MTKMPTLLEMLKAGVHFGHQKSRWHPKMEQFIFGVRNGVHIIDLEKTQEQLEKSLNYVKNLAAKGQVILFVGTKRQAREITKEAAVSCEMPYLVERWIGGLLTNFDEVKRRLKKYHNLKEMFASGEIEKYTKKEQVTMKKQLEKLDKYLIGLTTLDKMPDALYIADMRTEKTALAEAERTEITTVAVCDTNVNPEQVNYAIPANDDAVNSIKLIVDLVAEAVNEGRKEFEKKKLERAKEEPVKHDAVKIERRALKKEESV
ncbi:MAG: 30S ribosomal protein S2 [Candidatus Magasanikbacteria bacterium GW2011_GWA2_40_10]|uniref:Small ribosomal subunit protein uS2 n=1 Tax=Candidatus Magasanikbacteria bacterium GW2011_GWA2_40_10 TaxID=1619037 RepID=A0A0G0SJW0_9BACT|nr:MAG: 30S ribosomal protein S2 [Candidatus Magasanikbacteria bacterium GW2011_GWA2_40_10]